ncbi:ABC transporter permease [Hoeflea prorocentri]|uniref:ABC transporter permease n=1 Tax=Hoeflea prorocentri TaxID=1922333 RepID=A0A9X3UJS8_9HYPH|nr:ABC transporter permease [Hoeflea prorocentri]MCY6381907.1 ABC transporter permease [Hoeflea prorocentri]MDA5399707.1 ABC transporter permease [Hoeflea prorocentri]
MLGFVLKRTGDAILTAFLVFTFVFFAMRLLPGDPVVAMLGDRAGAETIANVRRSLGLDQPLLVQYGHFLRDLLHFDLGTSLINGASVGEMMARNLPYTIMLTLASTVVGIVIGLPLGVLSAMRAGKMTDHTTRVVSLFGSALPDFYVGVLFLLFFGLTLRWFPLLGGGSSPFDLYHLAMPAMALGMLKGFGFVRLTRTAVLDVAGRDFVRTARALGLPRRDVVWRHILRNAMIPISTHLSLSIVATLGGTIALELVFNRPGVGQLLVGAVTSRDYTLIQGGIVILSILVVFVNLITDLLYAVIDPRVRAG